MRHNQIIVGCALLAATTTLSAAPAGTYAGSSATFSITHQTEIPGGTLKPGDYSIQVVDQLSDRMIVRVDSTTGKEHTIFLGVPHTEFVDAAAPGPVSWKSGPSGSTALRGFEFSPGTTVEFVYPKAEAAALAKLNTAKVIAVDPESEGRPVLKKMSQDDLQVVTLWMLSLTTAGPQGKTPAIAAQKYTGEDLASRPVVAGNAPPVQLQTPPQQTVEVAAVDQPAAPVPSAKAPVKRHVVAQLPHTASPLPIVWLVGVFSLLLAGLVRFGRLARN